MKKWELARYLIDAKKCVDSLMYISRNVHALRNFNLMNESKDIRSRFYINCCIVLDNSYGKQKKKICDTDKIVEKIYYERDKNSAHKDPTYSPREYNTWTEEIEEKKKELIRVREICKDYLPEILTINFVPHDRRYFRYVHSVTAEREEEIKHIKHPKYGEKADQYSIVKEIQVVYDVEEIKNIPDEKKEEYGTILEAGLNMYETIQNMQDFCVVTNVLCDTEIWMTPREEMYECFIELEKMGFIDQFGIPNFDVLEKPENDRKFRNILEKYQNDQT